MCCERSRRTTADQSAAPARQGRPRDPRRADPVPTGTAANAPAGHPGHRPAVAPPPGHPMPLLDLLNYRWMERKHLGGHPAGRAADLARLAEGVLRRRALEAPVGLPQAPDAVVELRRTFAPSIAMSCLICTDVCADWRMTLRRTCLRTLMKEMRSGSIRSWPASAMMIRVRQRCTARCAHTSWRTSSGSADRKISCGPRWNVLTCRNEPSMV